MTTAIKNLDSIMRSLRERSGFTQSNIASYLGVDQSLISKFEKGERAITSDMLEKLTDLYGVPLSDLGKEQDKAQPLNIALRASGITPEDMTAIGAINRIALSCNLITRLLESR